MLARAHAEHAILRNAQSLAALRGARASEVFVQRHCLRHALVVCPGKVHQMRLHLLQSATCMEVSCVQHFPSTCPERCPTFDEKG